MSGVYIDVNANDEKAQKSLKGIDASIRRIMSSSNLLNNNFKNIGGKDFKDLGTEVQKTENNLKNFERTSAKTTKSVKDNTSSLATGFKNLAISIGTAVAAWAGLSAVNKFNATADALTNLQNRLKLVTDDMNSLYSTQERMYQLAKSSRSDFADMTNLFVDFSLALQEKNFPVKRIEKVVDLINKAGALSGSTQESLKAANVQLMQGISSDTLRGEELNSVMEQHKYLQKILKENLRMTSGELRNFASEGKFSADLFVNTVLNSADKIERDFAKAAVTASVAFDMLWQSIRKFSGEINQAIGLASGFSSRVIVFRDYIDLLNESFAFSMNSKSTIAEQFDKVRKSFVYQLAILGYIAHSAKISLSVLYDLYSTQKKILQFYDKIVEKAKGLNKEYIAPFFEKLFGSKENDSPLVSIANFLNIITIPLNLLKVVAVDIVDSLKNSFTALTPVVKATASAAFLVKTSFIDWYLSSIYGIRNLTRHIQGFADFFKVFSLGTKRERAFVDIFKADSIEEFAGAVSKLAKSRDTLLGFSSFDVLFSDIGYYLTAYVTNPFRDLLVYVGLAQNRLFELDSIRFARLSNKIELISESFKMLYTDILFPKIGSFILKIIVFSAKWGSTLYDGIMGQFTFEKGVNAGKRFANGIFSAITVLKDIISSIFNTGISSGSLFKDLVKEFLTSIPDIVSAIFVSILGFIKGIVIEIKKLINFEELFSKASDDLLDFLKGLVDSTENYFNSFKEKSKTFFEDLFSGISIEDAVDKSFIFFKKRFKEILVYSLYALDLLVDVIFKFAKRVKDAFYSIYEDVIGHSSWVDTIAGIIDHSNRLSEAEDRFRNFYLAIINLGRNAKEKMAEFSSKVFNTDNFEAIITKLKDVASQISYELKLAIGVAFVAAFREGFIGILGKIALFNNLGSILQKYAPELLYGIFSVMGDIIGSFVGMLIENLKAAVNLFIVAAPSIVRALVEGVFGTLGKVINNTFGLILQNNLLATLSLLTAGLLLFSKDFRKIFEEGLLGTATKITGRGNNQRVTPGQAGILGINFADMFSSGAGSALFQSNRLGLMAGAAFATAFMDSISLAEASVIGLPLLVTAILGPDGGLRLAKNIYGKVTQIINGVLGLFSYGLGILTKKQAFFDLAAWFLIPRTVNNTRSRLRQAISDLFLDFRQMFINYRDNMQRYVSGAIDLNTAFTTDASGNKNVRVFSNIKTIIDDLSEKVKAFFRNIINYYRTVAPLIKNIFMDMGSILLTYFKFVFNFITEGFVMLFRSLGALRSILPIITAILFTFSNMANASEEMGSALLDLHLSVIDVVASFTSLALGIAAFGVLTKAVITYKKTYKDLMKQYIAPKSNIFTEYHWWAKNKELPLKHLYPDSVTVNWPKSNLGKERLKIQKEAAMKAQEPFARKIAMQRAMSELLPNFLESKRYIEDKIKVVKENLTKILKTTFTGAVDTVRGPIGQAFFNLGVSIVQMLVGSKDFIKNSLLLFGNFLKMTLLAALLPVSFALEKTIPFFFKGLTRLNAEAVLGSLIKSFWNLGNTGYSSGKIFTGLWGVFKNGITTFWELTKGLYALTKPLLIFGLKFTAIIAAIGASVLTLIAIFSDDTIGDTLERWWDATKKFFGGSATSTAGRRTELQDIIGKSLDIEGFNFSKELKRIDFASLDTTTYKIISDAASAAVEKIKELRKIELEEGQLSVGQYEEKRNALERFSKTLAKLPENSKTAMQKLNTIWDQATQLDISSQINNFFGNISEVDKIKTDRYSFSKKVNPVSGKVSFVPKQYSERLIEEQSILLPLADKYAEFSKFMTDTDRQRLDDLANEYAVAVQNHMDVLGSMNQKEVDWSQKRLGAVRVFAKAWEEINDKAIGKALTSQTVEYLKTTATYIKEAFSIDIGVSGEKFKGFKDQLDTLTNLAHQHYLANNKFKNANNIKDKLAAAQEMQLLEERGKAFNDFVEKSFGTRNSFTTAVSELANATGVSEDIIVKSFEKVKGVTIDTLLDIAQIKNAIATQAPGSELLNGLYERLDKATKSLRKRFVSEYSTESINASLQAIGAKQITEEMLIGMSAEERLNLYKEVITEKEKFDQILKDYYSGNITSEVYEEETRQLRDAINKRINLFDTNSSKLSSLFDTNFSEREFYTLPENLQKRLLQVANSFENELVSVKKGEIDGTSFFAKLDFEKFKLKFIKTFQEIRQTFNDLFFEGPGKLFERVSKNAPNMTEQGFYRLSGTQQRDFAKESSALSVLSTLIKEVSLPQNIYDIINQKLNAGETFSSIVDKLPEILGKSLSEILPTTPIEKNTNALEKLTSVFENITNRLVTNSFKINLDNITGNKLSAKMLQSVTDNEGYAKEAGEKYNIDPKYLLALMLQESGGDITARSPKGAEGLFQFIPSTAKQYNVDVTNARSSFMGAAEYFRYLLDEFNQDLEVAAAAFNAGEGTVKKYGNQIPPFKETKDHGTGVKSYYKTLIGIQDGATELNIPLGNSSKLFETLENRVKNFNNTVFSNLNIFERIDQKLSIIGYSFERSVLNKAGDKGLLSGIESYLDEIIALKEKINKSKSPEDIKDFEERVEYLTVALDLLQDKIIKKTNIFADYVIEAGKSFNESIKNGMTSSLSSFLKGETTWEEFGDALLNMFTSNVIDTFVNGMMTSLFSEQGIFKSLFNNMGVKIAELATSSFSGGSGFFDSIFSSIKSFFSFASGGLIVGPGSGTSDSIPIMASNREFIVNAKSTKRFLPLLQAINSGSISKYAEGGLVTVGSLQKVSSESISSKRNQQVFNINITGDISRQTKAEIYGMIPQLASSISQHNFDRNYRR